MLIVELPSKQSIGTFKQQSIKLIVPHYIPSCVFTLSLGKHNFKDDIYIYIQLYASIPSVLFSFVIHMYLQWTYSDLLYAQSIRSCSLRSSCSLVRSLLNPSDPSMHVSKTEEAAKAAQEPQVPWSFTGVTILDVTELTEAGAEPRLKRKREKNGSLALKIQDILILSLIDSF